MHGSLDASARRCAQLLFVVAAISMAACSQEAKTARASKRANEYFQKQRYDEAKIEYANVLRLDPNNAEAIRNLGAIWMEQGAPFRALPYLLRTSKDNPSDLETRVRIAAAFLAMDGRGEAANVAAAVLREQPDHPQALTLLADAARHPAELEQVIKRVEEFPKKDIGAYHLALGSMQLKSGDLAAGEKSLVESSRLDPKDPLPYLALANLAIIRKQMDVAGKHYQTASELAAPRSLASMAYAEFLLQSKRLQEASDALEPALKKAPDYFPARRLKAQIAFALGNKDDASRQVQEILRQDPENLEGGILQAQMWLAEGKSAQATELIDRLNKKFPKYPVIRFELARCANASGNSEQAIQILDELVRSKPDYAQAVLVLNELRLRKGSAGEAAAALESFCAQRQTYPPAIILLAQSYRALGRHSDAIAAYRRLSESDNARGDVTYLIGMTHREANQLGEAEACFLEVLKLNPKAIAPLEQLVAIDLVRKDYSKASERVASRSQDGSQSAELELLKARIEAAQGKWDMAEASLNRAGEMDPALPGVYQLLINTYLATGKLERALKQAEALSEQKPNDLRALTTVAVISARLGHPEKAISAYERLLSKDPASTTALNNLACLYLEQPAQLDKAYALAKKAREQKASDPAIADTLGWICFKRKEFSQALSLLRESSSQLSDNAEAMYHYAMACSAMGLWGQAAAAFEKSAASPQEFSGKSEIPSRIALFRAPEKYSIEQLAEMGEQTPDDISVWHRLGEKLRDAGRHADSAAAFENALKVNPQAFPCVMELAMLNAGPLQNPQMAAELSKRARTIAPGDAESKLALGRLAYRTKDWTAAYLLLAEAVRELKAPEASLELARSAYALGKVSEATELVSGIAKSSPSKEQEEANRLLTALGTAKPERDSLIRDALARTPDDPIILIAVAKELQRLGNRAEAGDHFDRVVQLLPDSPVMQKELAAFYLEDPTKLSLAHDYAAKARRSLPEDAGIAAILAETSFLRKEFGNARRLFEECEKAQPLTPRARYYLAVCNWELKDSQAAAEALRRALSEGLPSPLRGEAEKLLKACESQAPEARKES
jgi:tetratricopeptide (TPR) repeat protein